MSLPKIATPTFELIVPSTQKKVKYRPFLVKEEKALLFAKESNEGPDIHNALRQLINACVLDEDFNIDDLTIVDMTYIFIKIRAVSVDNIAKFTIKDIEDGIDYDLEVNLDEVEVTFPEDFKTKVELGDGVGVALKQPTPKLIDKLKGVKTKSELIYNTVMECIDYIYDENEIYPWNEEEMESRSEWLDSLPVEKYEEIKRVFENAPKIEHKVTYTNSNGKERELVFSELTDFFDFR